MKNLRQRTLGSVVLATVFMIGGLAAATSAVADPFFFSTSDPDGKMATASRPGGATEIESADDFVLSSATNITGATFRGLLPVGSPLSNVTQVVVEIYRVFPADSDVGRTSGPPAFSTPQVPTRVNSPSDVALDSRDAVSGNLSFTPGVVQSSFTANNSVLNGINLKTGGEGAVTGEEVQFNVAFKTPFSLPPDHYFFVPQVQLSSGDFFWLSAAKPIVAPGTPFPAGFTDLQSWIRNGNLDPDWLRVGTDIVDGSPAPTFNAAFSLSGVTVPEPTTMLLLGSGLVSLIGFRRKFRK